MRCFGSRKPARVCSSGSATTRRDRNGECGRAGSDASPFDAGRGYTVVAEVFQELGDPEKARELYELAAELLTPMASRYLLEVYQKLAELLEAEGRKDEAARGAQEGRGRPGRSCPLNAPLELSRCKGSSAPPVLVTTRRLRSAGTDPLAGNDGFRLRPFVVASLCRARLRGDLRAGAAGRRLRPRAADPRRPRQGRRLRERREDGENFGRFARSSSRRLPRVPGVPALQGRGDSATSSASTCCSTAVPLPRRPPGSPRRGALARAEDHVPQRAVSLIRLRPLRTTEGALLEGGRRHAARRRANGGERSSASR